MKLQVDTNTRYHRQELITWWDQSKLLSSKVLVVGAGALGNEIVKDLTLVGVGHIDIVDMDTIEHSNLARCVFFRLDDEGQPKSEVLARAAGEMNSDVQLRAFVCQVQRVCAAAISEYDLVIGALDNREARVWVSKTVRKLGGYWIDGAIEGLRGLARMFGPEGPCYACTLNEADWVQLSRRKSCSLLAPEEIQEGKTPTNATTAAIIAGVQAQEAVKFLVGATDQLALIGKCWVYTGDSMESYVVAYREDEWCLDHDSYGELVLTVAKTPQELLSLVENCEAVDFEEDVITFSACPECGGSSITKMRSALSEGSGRCSNCMKELPGEISTSLLPSDERLSLSFIDLGICADDVVTLRSGEERTHFRVKGDLIGHK
jgi:adenylyltransferase/sulfurtransferase